jgi:hypothetical protein
MKTLKSILAVSILSVATVSIFAVPPSKRTSPSHALRTGDEFSRVNAGDKLALVCKQCDTVSLQTVASKDETMELCKEGASVTCPSCSKTYKVVAYGPSGKGGKRLETRIVNEKGEECMFVAKIKE